ncbi:MAG: fibronectin type III domain-containing protein, partial [Cytophagales bacterium]|nr:fibronectin type III domain-containing protein [Cytophagales bacterium]
MKTKTTLMALAMFVLLASATAYPQNCYPDVNTGKISKATPALIFFEGKLHMLHLGDNSNEIWYSTFDGNTWTENVPIGQQSKVTPVMTVFNDRLHMLHLGKSSNQISYSILEGGSWRPSVEIGQLSKAAPVLAVFNGKLHMLHLGDRSNEIWYSTLEGDTWTPNVRIGQQSKATPVMAVFNDQLHMLHLGDTSNEIWYSTFDGNAWTRNVRIGQQSKATPVMAVFNGKLHMLHLGDSSDEIWYSTFDGNAWTRNLPIGQQGKATPVMAVFNGRLHMLYLGNPSNQIWYSYLDGGAWAPKVPLPDRSSKATPVMAGIGDTGPDAALHVVRTGSSSNYIFHGIIPPVPNAPSEVSFDNIGKRSARVSWKDNATIEERFTVYRSLHPTDDFKPVGTITVGCLPAGSSEGETYSFEDRSLEPGKAYYYRVRAENLGGPSDFSETARVATLPPNLPEAPGSLSIDAMKEVTESSIPIRWQDNADNETGFEVFVEETGRRYTIRQQNATGYTITSLNPNTTYCITVRAFNEDGFSENASNRVCATTSMSTAPAQLSASYWIGPFPQPGPCDPADLQWIFTPVQLTGSRGKDMQFMVPGRYRGELQSVLRPATGSQPGRIEWWCKYTGLLSDIRPGTWNVNVRSASWQAQCMVTLNSGSNMVNFTQFRNSCYTSPQPPAATMAGSIPSEREADHRNAALRGLKADPQPLGRSAAGGTIGRLDPDFGNNGLQTTAIFSNANGLEEQGLEVLTNAHGDMFHVLQVGSFIRVAKYLPGGRLDLSYGNAGYSNAVPLSGTSAAMQGDHIIIAGFMDGDFALARCTADGALDPAFGNNGIATTDFVGSFAVAQSVIVRGDRIMAGGYTFNA